MYSLILIDDEKLFIRNICDTIDFDTLDIKLVATAFDGEDGYKKILEHLPDIIICDIDMPKLNGFKMLERVSDIKDYKPQIIMFTGFNSFEYAKQAISFQVVDYLVKPCMPDEIISALSAAKAACDRSQFNICAEYSYKENQIAAFINDIIHSNSFTNLELIEKQQSLGISVYSDSYILLCIHFSSRYNSKSINYKESTHIVCSKIVSCITDSFKNSYHTSFGYEHMYLLLTDCRSNDIIDFLNKLLVQNTDSTMLSFISVSNICHNISELPTLLEQVEYCSKFSFCFDENKLLLYRTINAYIKSTFKNQEFMKCENSLKNNLSIGSANKRNYIDTVRDFLKSFEYYDPDYFKNMIYNAITSLISNYFNLTKDQEYDTDSSLWSDISKTTSASELITLYTKIISKFDTIHNATPEVRYNIISTQLKEYVQKNYMNSISSVQLAKKFYISERRLRDIFFNVNQITLNEYIKIYRMQKAIELLKTSNLPIQDICKQVGYNNILHFRQTFTEFFGKSPSEYSKKIKNKDKSDK